MIPKVTQESNTINLFSTNAALSYSLKTSENLRFSNVFREYKSEKLIENGLMLTKNFLSKV